MDTGLLINKLSNCLRRRSARLQKDLGVSSVQSSVLDYLLVETGRRPVVQRDIEQEFGLRPASATGLLQTLEKSGLIIREADPADARRKRIVFTSQAENLRTAICCEVATAEALLRQGISEQEWHTFMSVGLRMLDNLNNADKLQAQNSKEAN